jgi:hypothetical protein
MPTFSRPTLRRPFSRLRRGRSFALVDYLCGSIILTATMLSVTSLTTLKSRTLRASKQHQNAIFCANNILNTQKLKFQNDPNMRATVYKLVGAQSNKKNWTTYSNMDKPLNLKQVESQAKAVLEFKAVEGLDQSQYLEMRVNIQWTWDGTRSTACHVSTLVAGGIK